MERIYRHPFRQAESVDGYDVYSAFYPDGRRYDVHDLPLARAIERGDIVTDEEIHIERGDGSRGVLLVRAAPVHDEDGEVVAGIVLFDDITVRKNAENELAAARERSAALVSSLQQSLLPAALPQVPGLEFGAAFSPVGEGLEVGGDFYDVFEPRDGEWVAVVGDVMGKGVAAAAITSLARHSLRTAALRELTPSALLSTLNEALLSEGEYRPFCTVAASVLRREGDAVRVELGLGGHPRPMVVHPDGRVESVGTFGTLIGVVPDVDVRDMEFVLQPGDALVFFTDGVTEAHVDNTFLGEEGLRTILQSLAPERLSAAGIASAVQHEVNRFVGAGLRDDLAVLVVRVAP